MHTETVGQGHLYISAGISLSSSLNSRNSFLLEESQDEVDDVTFPPFQVRKISQVIEEFFQFFCHFSRYRIMIYRHIVHLSTHITLIMGLNVFSLILIIEFAS